MVVFEGIVVDARRAKGPQGHTDFVAIIRSASFAPSTSPTLGRSCAYRARTLTVSPTVVSIERSVS